ncbi:MAG: hypothetical protein BGO69_03005 [Bacteroidetes bacterium 46-16]|nr:MAG: hypothetical protein BGO69_03005 [Bacteroidetes bacterium 46-16]
MKHLYKIITTSLILCGFGNAGAQLSSRIVAMQSDQSNGTTWEHADSTRYIFNPGNNNPGDAMTVSTMKDDSAIFLIYAASVYNPYYKHAYTYDAQGNLSEHLWLAFTAPNTWTNNEKDSYTYDANNNMLTQKAEQWDAPNNTWKNFYLEVRTYSGMNLVNDSNKYWDAANNDYYTTNAHSYTYSGDTVFHYFDTYDYPSQTWSHYSKNYSVYDANHNEIASEYFYWHSWLNDYRQSSLTSTTYDANNQATYSISKNWDTSTAGWVNAYQANYVYDVNNVLTNDSSDTWDTGTNSWVHATANSHIHNAANNTDTTIGLKWDVNNSIFVNDVRYTGTYNTYNQMTSSLTEHWDNAASMWAGANYDHRYKYYYELVNLAVASVHASQPQVVLYPSPASTFINLSVNWQDARPFTVSVVDMQGRVHMQFSERGSSSYKRTIPLTGLPAGNYTVLIRFGAVTAADRFTIIR